MKPYVPRVVGEDRPRTELIDLDCPDEELVRISNERVLALTLEEMRILRDYLKNEHHPRPPEGGRSGGAR